MYGCSDVLLVLILWAYVELFCITDVEQCLATPYCVLHSALWTKLSPIFTWR